MAINERLTEFEKTAREWLASNPSPEKLEVAKCRLKSRITTQVPLEIQKDINAAILLIEVRWRQDLNYTNYNSH